MYRSYYPHRSRYSLSPLCRILKTIVDKMHSLKLTQKFWQQQYILAHSPTLHSRMVCEVKKINCFYLVIFANNETNVLSSLFPKEFFCDWSLWPRTFVNGSKKTLEKYMYTYSPFIRQKEKGRRQKKGGKGLLAIFQTKADFLQEGFPLGWMKTTL